MSATRKVVHDYTFSDGTFVAAGAYMFVPQAAVQRDPEHYPDPETFKPWRFLEKNHWQGASAGEAQQSTTTTSPEFLLFGHGKSAW